MSFRLHYAAAVCQRRGRWRRLPAYQRQADTHLEQLSQTGWWGDVVGRAGLERICHGIWHIDVVSSSASNRDRLQYSVRQRTHRRCRRHQPLFRQNGPREIWWARG